MTPIPARRCIRARPSASSHGPFSTPRRCAGIRAPSGSTAAARAGRVYAVTLDGTIEVVATTGGSILGIAVDADGIVYACDWHKDEVLRVDPATGAWSTYTAGAPELRIDDPNSPVFAEDGTMYVTGSENPAIFRVEPGGVTTVWSHAAPGYPNGATLTPSGDALIVAESHPDDFDGGRIWRIPIRDDGSAGDAEIVAELWHTVPDGVASTSTATSTWRTTRPTGSTGSRPTGRCGPSRRTGRPCT